MYGVSTVIRGDAPAFGRDHMNFAPGNHLIGSSGQILVRNLMRFAHQTARRAAAAYKEFQARQAHKHVNLQAPNISYAWHLADAMKQAWTRAHQMQRIAA
jgi:hypothetical protein